ncbi:hypothetical protein [Enterococcus thailandicus]|uniref:hypothetical protein n=1 Tax=Enterococcus thailandicus TaxID=417368 RepID=UPI0034DD5A70
MNKKWVNEHPIKFLLCMFTPIVVITLLGKEWQFVAIFFIATIIYFVLNGLGDFDVFKITKEGIELKRTINEARDTLEEISKQSITMLKMNLRQSLKLGYPNGLFAIRDYKFFEKYYAEIEGIDEELDNLFLELKQKVLHLISYNIIHSVNDVYGYLQTIMKDDYTQISMELEALKNKMNKNNVSLWELREKNEYFYDFDLLREALDKEVEIFEDLKQKELVESKEIKGIYKYCKELLKEFESVLE